MAAPRASFKTAKGTELPLLNLKGKEYLVIANRLVWFREEMPQAAIKTQMINSGGEGKDTFYIFKAEIYVPTANGQLNLVATAHKRETVGDFPDAMEKAEMGSVGRALGLLGYGTQFAADDLDEGTRLADSPVATPDATPAPVANGSSFRNRVTTGARGDL